jgi:GT2 family glycosyltransferase
LGVATRLLSRWVIAPPVPKSTVEVDWISGSCMLIRRAALEEVGLFDERFFLYYEEVDLCRRTREAGWSIYWVPEATIVHVGGLATGFNQTQKRRARYWFDSRRYYLLKARGRSYLWLANTAWLSGFAAWRVRRWLMQKPDADPPRLLTDFVRWTILSPNRLERAPRKLPTS